MKDLNWGAIVVVAVIVLSLGVLGLLIALGGDEPTNFEESLADWAEEAGVNRDEFLEAYNGEEARAAVEEDNQEGLDKLGGNAATPSVFINDEQITPSYTVEEFSATVQSFVDANESEEAVVIEVYEDFNCGFCAQFFPVSYLVADQFGDQVELVHKSLPFLKPDSTDYAVASEAVEIIGGKQAAFEFDQLVFEDIHGQSFDELDSLKVE